MIIKDNIDVLIFTLLIFMLYCTGIIPYNDFIFFTTVFYALFLDYFKFYI